MTKGKATAVKGKATTKAKTKKVVASDEVVLDAKSDITQGVTMVTCTECGIEKEQTTENFSRLKGADGTPATGKFRNICKPCQTAASIAWTTRRKDYREVYQRAVRYRDQLGIPALTPNAKDWKAGDPIMTVAYTDKNGVFHESRNADEVYAEMKQAQAEARETLKAQRAEAQAEAKAQRAEARAQAKLERESAQAEAKELRAKERAEAKAQRAEAKALKAEELRVEREEKAKVRAQERAEAIAKKAEETRLARETKAQERAETARLKAEAKANEAIAKAEAKSNEAMEKALSAIAGA